MISQRLVRLVAVLLLVVQGVVSLAAGRVVCIGVRECERHGERVTTTVGLSHSERHGAEQCPSGRCETGPCEREQAKASTCDSQGSDAAACTGDAATATCDDTAGVAWASGEACDCHVHVPVPSPLQGWSNPRADGSKADGSAWRAVCVPLVVVLRVSWEGVPVRGNRVQRPPRDWGATPQMLALRATRLLV